MTVTRLGQVHAETGSSGEYSKLTSFGVTLETTIVHSGFYAWNCGSGAGIGLTFPQQDHIRAYFAVYISSISLGGVLFSLHSSGAYSNAVSVRLEADFLDIYVNNVSVESIATLSTGFIQGAWNEMSIVYKSGSSGAFTIWLNGLELFTYEGTFPGQLDYFITLSRSLLLDGFGNAILDDLYVDAITEDEPAVPPSSKIFLSSLATNQGVVEWSNVGDTPNYRCIDDPAAPDNDSTYIKTLVPGVQDLYIISPISVPTDYKIRAVIPTSIAKKGDAALNATLSAVIFDGLNVMVGTPKSVGLSYSAVWNRFDFQPDGTAWDETDYEAMQFGIRAEGTF